MSNDTQTSNGVDDLTTLLMMLMGALAMGGGVLGAMFAPVRLWMIEHHVLASGQDVVLKFTDDGGAIGLGWAQLIVLGGLVLALIVVSISWKMRRAARLAGR